MDLLDISVEIFYSVKVWFLRALLRLWGPLMGYLPVNSRGFIYYAQSVWEPDA